MRRAHGLTLIEVIIVAAILVVLLGIVLPVLAHARRQARIRQNIRQVRGIHQAMLLYTSGNNTYYPGLDTHGELDTPKEHGGDGRDPDWRLYILVNKGFLVGDRVISPIDTKTVWTTGQVTADVYSYALLDLDQAPERTEWRDNLTTEAAVVSDRNTGSSTNEAELNSLWTGKKGDWRGNVGWNDNHVTFETEGVGHTTKYGSFFNDGNDDLFQDDDVTRGDAQMVYGDPDLSSE